MVDVHLLVQHVTVVNVMISFLLALQIVRTGSTTLQDELEALIDKAILENENTMDTPFIDTDASNMPVDKRVARLSYNYGGNRNRNNHYNSRYYRSRYYANYRTPWRNLPDTYCFRDKCKSDRECCRRYSKCDKSAKVCYDCWYGHPCKSSRDCCEKYPYCSSVSNTCQS